MRRSEIRSRLRANIQKSAGVKAMLSATTKPMPPDQMLAELGTTLPEARSAALAAPTPPATKAEMTAALAAYRKDAKTTVEPDADIQQQKQPVSDADAVQVRPTTNGTGDGTFAIVDIPRYSCLKLDDRSLVSVPVSNIVTKGLPVLFGRDDALMLLDKLFSQLPAADRTPKYFTERKMNRKAPIDVRHIAKLKSILTRMATDHAISREDLITCWQHMKSSMSFGIGSMVCARTGLALFQNGAFVNHSCRPNCIAIITTDVFRIWTVRDIQADEELTVGYQADLTEPMPFAERDPILRLLLHSACRCRICLAERSVDTKKPKTMTTADDTKRSFDELTGTEQPYDVFCRSTTPDLRLLVLLTYPLNQIVYRLTISFLQRYFRYGLSMYNRIVEHQPSQTTVNAVGLYFCLIRRTVQCMVLSRIAGHTDVQLMLWQAYMMLLMEGRMNSLPFPLSYERNGAVADLAALDRLAASTKRSTRIDSDTSLKLVETTVLEMFTKGGLRTKTNETDNSSQIADEKRIGAYLPPAVTASTVYKDAATHYRCIGLLPLNLPAERIETQPTDCFARTGIRDRWRVGRSESATAQ